MSRKSHFSPPLPQQPLVEVFVDIPERPHQHQQRGVFFPHLGVLRLQRLDAVEEGRVLVTQRGVGEEGFDVRKSLAHFTPPITPLIHSR